MTSKANPKGGDVRAEKLVRDDIVVASILSNDKLMDDVRQALTDEKKGKGVARKDLKSKNARR